MHRVWVSDWIGPVPVQVRAATFLHKYSAPTLLVLYEAEPTWAGRLRDKKDTMRIAAVSIAAAEQKLAEIWEAGELPSDAFSLIPVASGGALIICRHLIIFQAQVGHAATVQSSSIMGMHPVVCSLVIYQAEQA